MLSVRLLLLSAAASALVAAVTWVAGGESGKLWSLRPAGEYCGPHVRALSWHFLPLTHQCLYTDGTSRELVPGWVNPLFFASLATMLVLLSFAMRAANRP